MKRDVRIWAAKNRCFLWEREKAGQGNIRDHWEWDYHCRCILERRRRSCSFRKECIQLRYWVKVLIRVGLCSDCATCTGAPSSGNISIELVNRVVGESISAAGSIEESAGSIAAGRVSRRALASGGNRLVVIGGLVGETCDALEVCGVEVILSGAGGVRIGRGRDRKNEGK